MLWAAVLLLLSQAPIPPIPPVPPLPPDSGGFLGLPTAMWNLLIAAALGWLIDRARRASERAATAAADASLVAAKAVASETEKVRLELVIKGKELELAILAAAKEAAGKVEDVKTTLEETRQDTKRELGEMAKVGKENAKVGRAVHVLVNSSMSIQLKISATALRRIADMTKDPEDEKAATLAESAYHDHEAKQHVVDEGGSVEPDPPAVHPPEDPTHVTPVIGEP